MPTTIWGREAEVEAIIARVRDRRVVTLTGPGGIGKTALASMASVTLAPEFAYGSVWIDLTRVDDPEGVAEAVASQLGYADFDSLLDSPGDQPTLIVVDNCEHVLDAASDTVAAILDACRMPTVLATSRAPLDLPDESILTVGPLSVPAEDADDDESAALRLLVERIRDHGVDPERIDRAVLGEICRRLDGVPLALELAASRLRSAAPAELLRELDERPHALARRRFRGQSSHRSVAELVGWSTDLLDDTARAVFARLGAFAGPFTASMAEAVAGADLSDGEFRDALDALVESSLVIVDGAAGAAHFRLLHPVRAVAVDTLRASGELGAVHSRFIDQVVEGAIDVIVRTTQSWDADAIPDLIAAYDNMAASIRWLVDNEDEPDRALTLLAVMWALVHQTHTAEIARLGEVVLATWTAVDSPMWPDAVATVATCRTLTGRYAESVELASATLPVADRSPYAPATLRRVLAQTYRILGDPVRSIETFTEGVRVAEASGALGFALELEVDIGAVLAEVGRHDEGLEVADRAIRRSIEVGSVINEAWAMAGRAHVLLEVDPERSAVEAERAHQRCVELDYPAGRSCSLRVLSRARFAIGDLSGAAAAALALLDELLSRGGLHDLRLVADVAAAILRADGDPRWVDLAATSRALPVTTVMVPIEPAADDAGAGTMLSTRDAYIMIRSALTPVARRGAEPVAESEPRLTEPAVEATRAAIRSEGDVVRIDFGGRTSRYKSSKGLRDLARLVGRPDVEIAAVDLMEAGLVATAAESAHIDRQARRNYEERVRELAAEIERADADNDIGTAERLREEMDLIVDELTRSTGLGGRSRTGSTPGEKARSAVTQRIRGAIKRIGEHDPALGRHLDTNVTTGIFCSYADAGIEWIVELD